MLRGWVLTPRREAWVGVAVNNFCDPSILNTRCAMPRLDDEFVARLHVAKHYDFVVSGFGNSHHLSHCRHPAADESIKSFSGRLVCKLREVLHGMVSSRAARREHRHRVKTFSRPHNRVPG